MGYGITKEVNMGFDEVIEVVTEELKKEGFGVLTRIDVHEVMKKKLDVDFPRYVILGPCNPQLAKKALETEKEVGLLLPCNVIVYDDKGKIKVSAISPKKMLSIVENPSLEGIADEVENKMKKVIKNL